MSHRRVAPQVSVPPKTLHRRAHRPIDSIFTGSGGPPLPRWTAFGAFVVISSFLLVGCDLQRTPLNTAPFNKAGIDVSVGADASGDSSEIDATGDLARSSRLGGPLAGLNPAELARFVAGQAEFVEEETAEEGLGPVFNEAACVVCHNGPVGGTNGRLETRFGKWDRGRFDPLANLGGSLMQDHAIGSVVNGAGKYTYVAEVVPVAANVKAGRVTTPLFGLGLVNAVPDAALLELASKQARNFPSTRGTPNMVTEIATGALRVGRFGWKAQVATIHQFSGDAYLNEMGITSPEFPNENDPQGNHESLKYNPMSTINDDGEGVELFSDFMNLLGPPPRGPRTVVTDAGGQVFRRIGCVNCHTPTLVTGESPVAALDHKTFQPFSDFLLHDMGSLGDGIVQGQAGGRMMRTAPLWGLTSRPTYLHDGRARSPQAAILQHAGQGSDSRNRFLRLDPRERLALLAFLKSL